jgi:hypothetical protein
MDVISLVRPVFAWPPGGKFVQRAIFAIGRQSPRTAIHQLSMIHFARYVVMEQLPAHGQPRDRLRQPLQLFESNYNGTFDQYIDSFVDRIGREMHFLWGWSYGFPWGRLTATIFKDYIHRNEFEVGHWYAAYPDASVSMIKSALELTQAYAEFHLECKDLEPEAFLEAYRAFLTRVQDRL